MTASVLKQDPNTKRLKKQQQPFIYYDTDTIIITQIFGEIPIVKPQNDIAQPKRYKCHGLAPHLIFDLVIMPTIFLQATTDQPPKKKSFFLIFHRF